MKAEMSPTAGCIPGPVLPLHIEVAPVLHHVLDGPGAIGTVASSVGRDVAELTRVLGVPGTLDVTIEPAGARLRSGQPMRLTVGRRRCRYPDALLMQVAEHIQGERLPDVATWPDHLGGNAQLPGRLLARLCVEALSLQPALLFGPPQAAAYAEALADRATVAPLIHSGEWLCAVLREALSLRVSAADLRRVGGLLADAPNDPADASEILVAGLSSDVVEIRVPAGYLRTMTESADLQTDEQGKLAYLRDALFLEFGLPLPEFRIVMDDDLAPYGIQFTLNSLRMCPLLGIPPGHVLVNDATDRVRERGFDASPATNPATGQAACLARAESNEALQRAGWTTWDPLDYLVLALAATLRQQMRCLVNTDRVAGSLKELELEVPALLKTAASAVPVPSLTAVLRNLVNEGVSVRNLRRILERLLDSTDPFLVTESVAPPAVSDLAGLTSFVRRDLRQQVAHQYSGRTNTLVCCLTDPGIEELFGRGRMATDEEVDAVTAAIVEELARLPPNVPVPPLLTVSDTRDRVAAAVAAELPGLRVLSYEEIPAAFNVQPIARVVLPT